MVNPQRFTLGLFQSYQRSILNAGLIFPQLFLFILTICSTANAPRPSRWGDDPSRSAALLIVDHPPHVAIYGNELVLLLRDRRTKEWNLIVEMAKWGEHRNVTAERGIREETAGALRVDHRALDYGSEPWKPFKDYIRIPKSYGRHENITFVVKADMSRPPPSGNGWLSHLAHRMSYAPGGLPGYREADAVALVTSDQLFAAGSTLHTDHVKLHAWEAYGFSYDSHAVWRLRSSELPLAPAFKRSLTRHLTAFRTLIQRVNAGNRVLVHG